MIRLNGLIILCILLLTGNQIHGQETDIRQAVAEQMRKYPKSTLRDLYKNFFQDNFGPGHLVNDTVAAGNYLRQELAESDSFPGDYYEQTGYKGNFYRVNLSVIAEGIIAYDVYFDAFIRSVQSIRPMPVEEWKTEWARIESVIDSLNLPLENYEADRREIHSLLDAGKYVMHHSAIFEQTYSPHYRIVGRDIFLRELLPHIKNTVNNQ